MDKLAKAELTRLANKLTRTNFSIPKLPKEYPLYPRLFIEKLSKITHVPELRDNKSIFIASDYGGEHDKARFRTYSFLICGYDKLGMFHKQMSDLRSKQRLNEPFKEYAYKDLRYGPIKRSIGQYLELANRFVPGLLVNIAIDKSLKTVFGASLKTTFAQLEKIFWENDLGEWKGKTIEKLLRVCHPIAICTAILTVSGQKFIWMSDHDSINEDGNSHNFCHTQKVFMNILRMYTSNEYEIYGFAKSFKKSAMTADLLSLTDLSAGAFQDLLKEHYTESREEVNEQKNEVIKWLGREGLSLRKFNFVIRPDGDFWSYGQVDIKDKEKKIVEIPIYVKRKYQSRKE